MKDIKLNERDLNEVFGGINKMDPSVASLIYDPRMAIASDYINATKQLGKLLASGDKTYLEFYIARYDSAAKAKYDNMAGSVPNAKDTPFVPLATNPDRDKILNLIKEQYEEYDS